MTGREGRDPDGGRAEGSVTWLHALVPGAEELDLFEELDAAREREQWAERSHLQGFAELLAELFEGQKPTLDDVVEVLRRRGNSPVPCDGADPQRAADGGHPVDQPDSSASGDDEPAAGTVSPGQAAEMIAHLLGGRPVREDDEHERGAERLESPEGDAAIEG